MLRKFVFAIAVLISSLSSKAQILQPSAAYEVTPGDAGATYKEIEIYTEDDVKLKGWWLSPVSISSKKCVVMCDDGVGNMADNLALAGQFVTSGYYVLMFDWRGFGESDAFEMKPDYFIYAQFYKDVKAALGWVKKYQAKMTVVHMWGKGMGASLAIGAGAGEPKVTRIIADSPYITLEDVQIKYENAGEDKPKIPVIYDKIQLEPLYALEGGAQLDGVMYIVGANDYYSNELDIEKLVKVKKKEAYVYVVPDVESDETMSSNTNEYFKQIKDFLGVE